MPKALLFLRDERTAAAPTDGQKKSAKVCRSSGVSSVLGGVGRTKRRSNGNPELGSCADVCAENRRDGGSRALWMRGDATRADASGVEQRGVSQHGADRAVPSGNAVGRGRAGALGGSTVCVRSRRRAHSGGAWIHAGRERLERVSLPRRA